MPKTKLDRFDRRILQEMQRDSLISNLELADRVGLSPSPCSRRVRQLQEAGIIDRQVTLLNAEALGLPMTVYVQVSMERQTSEVLANFETQVTRHPEVLDCALITGSDADYLLKVVVPDLPHYQQFLLQELNEIPGVASIRSSFTLRQVVQRTELPLEHIQ